MAFEGSRRAARVRWKIGQPLLPEHFYAQEESLRAEVALRFAAFGAPSVGVHRLEWDEEKLRAGVLDIRQLTVFFSTGEVIDSESNAELPAPLDLQATGRSASDVFLHLESTSKFIASEPGDPHEEGVERIVHRLRLDTDPSREDGFAMLELGVFEQQAANATWQLAPRSLPSMVAVGNAAFRAHSLDAIERIIGNLRQLIARHKQQSIASTTIQAATALVRRGYHELESLWQHLEGAYLNPHPYQLFLTLQGMYFDLCVLHDCTPNKLFYRHHDLGGTFFELLEALQVVSTLKEEQLPHIPFRRNKGLRICTLTPGMTKGTRAFWLVKKKNVADIVNMRGVKLAASSRIEEVANRALPGIPFERVHNPPFSKDFSSNIEFYALSGGAEWDRAVAERALAFYDSGELSELEFYLYYTES